MSSHENTQRKLSKLDYLAEKRGHHIGDYHYDIVTDRLIGHCNYCGKEAIFNVNNNTFDGITLIDVCPIHKPNYREND